MSRLSSKHSTLNLVFSGSHSHFRWFYLLQFRPRCTEPRFPDVRLSHPCSPWTPERRAMAKRTRFECPNGCTQCSIGQRDGRVYTSSMGVENCPTWKMIQLKTRRIFFGLNKHFHWLSLMAGGVCSWWFLVGFCCMNLHVSIETLLNFLGWGGFPFWFMFSNDQTIEINGVWHFSGLFLFR